MAHREDSLLQNAKDSDYDILLFGLGRFGLGIAQELRKRDHRVLCVDFDPDLVRKQQGRGYTVRYGDAEDPEFLATLSFDNVYWVVSSVPELSINLVLLHGLREQNYNGRVAVTSHSSRHSEQLKHAGADQVLIPYADAAVQAVDNLFGQDK